MMAIMGSSSPKNECLYDPVRKKWVEKTPEEVVRQRLIKKMVEELEYPIALLAVEKELSSLPHLQLISTKKIPKRRADIIVFTKGRTSLFPLLMIECKALPLTLKFAQQVIGYNTFVKAPFVALANENQMMTGSYNEKSGMFGFTPGLPPYQTLINRLFSIEPNPY